MPGWRHQVDVGQRVADKKGSKSHRDRHYIRGFVLVQIEHMCGEIHTLVTQSDEKPSLDIEFVLIYPGPLHHWPHPQPIHRRQGQLRPQVEKGVRPFAGVENELALAVEFEPPPSD
jgi:hypothetical protein